MQKSNNNRLTLYIIIGLILGIIAGYFCYNSTQDIATRRELADSFSIITTVFLRLIKMIIAPLVISTLIVGIAKMGDIKAVGRIGIRSLVWFIFASIISLILGLVMVNLLRPGDGMSELIASMGSKSSDVSANSLLSIKDFFVHTVPSSIAEAMSKNEILQIVIFALFFGVALSSLGKPAQALIEVLEIVAHTMLKVTSYIMYLAPIAVFAAVADSITQYGTSIIKTYASFMGGFYLSIGILWLVLIALGLLILHKSIFVLVKMVRGQILLAFSTASSEAAYPGTLEQLEKFGVSNRIASFVLPIGYSFNLDGSMMYCTFASLFIAQAYGIHLSIGQQITMLFILMVTSKGIAGVPRASLVVIAATLHQFNIPGEGLLLIIGVDHFLDMARSATNVLGNSIAAAVVAKWEGNKNTD